MDTVYFINPRVWRPYMNPRDIDRIECLKAEQSRLSNQKTAGCGPTAACDMLARERTAREVLAELCLQKGVEADELNDLLKALPQELPYRADRALRRLIQK